MGTQLIHQIGNIGLRLVTMAGRFVLLFFLARLLKPSEVGLYGLVVVSVTYGIMLAGLDFYTFSTRELLAQPREKWAQILKAQGVLHVCAYAVVFPGALFLFAFGILPWAILGWFLLLLFAEHLARELNRVLVVASMPIRAGAALFLQKGLWSLVVPILMLTLPSVRSLEVVFLAWSAGAIGAIVFSIWCLRFLTWETVGGVDWRWIGRGLRVASLFLVGTILLQGILTLDRYVLELRGGLDLVGVYTFYVGVSLSLISFLDAGVFSFLYPRVVTAFKQGRLSVFRGEMSRLSVTTIAATAAMALIASILIGPVVELLQRPLYQMHIEVFWPLLAAVAAYGLGMVPHFALYAMGRDRAIVACNGIGFLTFIIVASLGTWSSPLTAVALGVFFGFFTLGLGKLLVYIATEPSEYLPSTKSVSAESSG